MNDEITKFALSVGTKVLCDLAKYIYTSFDGNKLNSYLRGAIISTLRGVVSSKYDSKGMYEDIADRMIYYLEKEADLFNENFVTDSISKSFEEYEQSNLNANEVSILFLAALPREIIKKPDLFKLINISLMEKILNYISDASITSIGHSDKLTNIENMLCNLQSKQKLIIEYFDDIREKVNLEVQRETNTLFIPKNFVVFFEKQLFLEGHLNDGKLARLSDIYIEPKYVINDFASLNDQKIYNNVIELIIDFANNNLKSKNYNTQYSFDTKHINTLFIKGHPGSGKSSLFYYLAYNKCYNTDFLPKTRMFFIKLIELLKANKNTLSDIDPLSDIIKHVGSDGTNLSNTVFVLDGLDEICAAKSLNINNYCNNLISALTSFKNCKVIITTRINYINISHEENKNVFNVQLLSFNKQDIHALVDKYFRIHNEKTELKDIAIENIEYASINTQNNYFEILSIPLLLYMILNTGVKIQNNNSVGKLYDTVFEELVNRRYNEEEDNAIQKHRIYNQISPYKSRQIAQEIAVRMYQKDKLLMPINSEEISTSLLTILDNNNTFDPLDNYYKKRLEKLFLITFFYKESTDVVEFAHKSIMEFFASEMLAGILLAENISLLERIRRIFTEKFITIEVFEFIKYRLKDWGNNSKYKEKLEKIEQELYSSFIHLLSSGELFNIESPNLHIFETNKMLFKAYWGLLRDVFYNKEKMAEIYKDKMFHYLLKVSTRIVDYEKIPFNENKALPLNLSESNLSELSLERCDLSYSNFNESTIRTIDFNYADLSNCVFDGSSIVNSSFYHANLENTSFYKVDFTASDLSYAIFKNTKIDNCDISNTNISNIIIEEDVERIINVNECRVSNNQLRTFAVLKMNLISPVIVYSVSLGYHNKIEKDRLKSNSDTTVKDIIMKDLSKRLSKEIEKIKLSFNEWKVENPRINYVLSSNIVEDIV